MSEVLKRGLPFLQRFTGLGRYLPKGAIRNNAYAAALFTPLDVAGNFMEGKNPIRAVGKPLFQLGGATGGGMIGGALGIPSGPGLTATAVAGGTGGYYGGGALFDQIFPERDAHLGRDTLRLAALTMPMGSQILAHLNRPSADQAKETLANVRAARTSPGKWFGLPDLGVTEMFSTKDPSQVRVGDVNFQQAKTGLAGDTDITATQKGLEQYGFNENFKLDTENLNEDGSIPIVRSEAGQKADALLAERDAWLARTANSPAAQAGFSDEQRWNLQQQTRDFRNAQKTGTMDEFAQKYPNSNTARERAIRNRIPSVMDMEF